MRVAGVGGLRDVRGVFDAGGAGLLRGAGAEGIGVGRADRRRGCACEGGAAGAARERRVGAAVGHRRDIGTGREEEGRAHGEAAH